MSFSLHLMHCTHPCLTATGIGLLIETAKPGSMFGQVAVIDFGTPFWSLSVSMNVLTTLLIAGRLIHRRQAYMESISRTNPSAYGAEIGIFLESAALYAIFAIIYIPMFAKNIPLQFPFSALLVSAAVRAALLSVRPRYQIYSIYLASRVSHRISSFSEWSTASLPNLKQASYR